MILVPSSLPRPDLVQTNQIPTSSPRPTSYIGRGNEGRSSEANNKNADLVLVQRPPENRPTAQHERPR